jgi:hypothetical protein
MNQTIDDSLRSTGSGRERVAVDIGSTVVKIARIGANGQIEAQQFFSRDFDAGIAQQVESLLERSGVPLEASEVLVCSSANGGLRVGVVCPPNITAEPPCAPGIACRRQPDFRP